MYGFLKENEKRGMKNQDKSTAKDAGHAEKEEGNMLTTTIITYIMAVFAVLGAIDRICGNRLGLGKKLEQAFFTMGPLVLSMAGMLVIAPVIARFMGPVMSPLFKAIGSDPAVFAGMFVGTDMGAAPLAEALAMDPRSGQLAGFVISSMMGATIVFHIPVAMEIAGKDSDYIARGMIAGLITIPLGCFAGGIAAGFPAALVLRDSLPVAAIAVLLVLGMMKFRKTLVRGFMWLGKFIQTIATAGLALGILQSLTGVTPVKGILPAEEAFQVIASVAIFLAGAFPLMHVLTLALKKPLRAAGRKLGINETAAAGPVMTLINSIPMLESMKEMDPRGKVINAAFCVSGAFAFGDFFGYVAAADASMLLPMVCGKLAAGTAAILLALVMAMAGAGKEANGNADSQCI